MYVTWQTILTAASLLTALGVIFGVVLKVHKWYLEQQSLKKELEDIKEEDTLICFALSACLDGLLQLGANHTVPVAKEKLDKFLNKRAHE
jgi:hypothetical protein